MTRTTFVALAAVAGACLLAPLTASAQGPGWLEDRSRAQGPGFRLGNFELHPGVGLEAGYDSNVFYRDAGSFQPREDSVIFRVSPHVYLTTLSGERLEEGEGRADDSSRRMFDLEAGVSSEVYFFLSDEVPHNVAVNGHVELDINPEGRFGATIFDRLSRTVRPFANRVDSRRINHGMLGNVAGLTLHGRTRGGVVKTSMGYAMRLAFFESNDFEYANRFIHQINAETHYRFLPNTSLFWDANADYTTFPNSGGALTLVDNWQLRTRVGLNGVVTPKLSITAAVGYMAAFVKDARFSDFDSVLALVGLKLRLTPTVTLGFGYDRDMQGSVVGLYRVQDRGYMDFQWLLGRSFLLAASFWAGRLDFGDVVDPAGMSLGGRKDIMVVAQLFGEYRFTDWLALNATLGYTGDFTDFEYQTDAGMGPVLEPAGFNKFEAWLGVRVFY